MEEKLYTRDQIKDAIWQELQESDYAGENNDLAYEVIGIVMAGIDKIGGKAQTGPVWVKEERKPTKGWTGKVRTVNTMGELNERKANWFPGWEVIGGEADEYVSEWLDESGNKPEPKWVKAALQWAKETIDFAWDYVKVPESLVETWGNMYMNTMNAIQQAQRETETAAAGREEDSVMFAEWLYKNRWFSFENNKWYYTFEQGTSISDKQYQKEYVKTTAELYKQFKQKEK